VVNSNKKQINFRLPSTLIETLKALAESENINVTDLVVELLEQGLASRVQTVALSKTAIAPSLLRSPSNAVNPLELQQQYERLAQELTLLKERVVLLESARIEQQSLPSSDKENVTPETDISGSIPWL
jgi:hypothetical protein